jgi:hypothetical protein
VLFSKIGRIEDGVFSERRSTSRFSNEKIGWGKVESRVRIADSGRVAVIFGTFVGSSFLISEMRENLAGGGGGYFGRSGWG